MEEGPRKPRNATKIILDMDFEKSKRNPRPVKRNKRKIYGRPTKAMQEARNRARGSFFNYNTQSQFTPKHDDSSIQDNTFNHNKDSDGKSSCSDGSIDDDFEFENDITEFTPSLLKLLKENEIKHMDSLLKLIENKYDNNSINLNDLWPNNTINHFTHDQQYVYPWIDLIVPGYSQPYCIDINLLSQKDTNHKEGCLFSYLISKDHTSNIKLLYLTTMQMYLIIDNITSQILRVPDESPIVIDWIEVSRASKVSENVCKEFWWSFDSSHIRDDCDGCIFSVDFGHYHKIDDAYYTDLKSRVRQLLHLTKESRDEQEKIISSYKKNQNKI